MLKFNELKEIISQIKYKDWNFVLEQKGDGFLLQVTFMGEDSVTGEVCLQKCRKWYISSHSCLSEIVSTAYKAVQAAEEHEMRERFSYKGRLIYNPHFHPDDVVQAIESEVVSLDARKK